MKYLTRGERTAFFPSPPSPRSAYSCLRGSHSLPPPGNLQHAHFLVFPLRVGNGISFRTNSAEWTRNGFRYSAEKSTHSKAFRVPRKSQFRSSERNGIPWKKLVLRNSSKITFKNDLSVHQKSSIRLPCFVLSWFLFHEMVRKWVEFIYIFCCTERNSELFSLPQNGWEQNSENLHVFWFHGTEF